MFFFFSSRRRHTRLQGDWSSDVCSSDLALGAERFLREIRIAAHLQHPHILTLIDSGEIPRRDGMGPGLLYYAMPYVEGETRSEERRVGKECRSRWSPYH